MIKLRLQRKGRKRRPYYHIVVADSRAPRDGRIIERLGRFDNVSESKELTYDEERIIHWLKIGAQPSDTVRNILKHEGILYKMHLIRWGKSEEEIAAALDEWRTAREAKGEEDDHSRKAKQEATLKAEEKEYKKQLEEKAAAAAKKLEKEQAEKKAAEEEAKAEGEESSDKEEKAETADASEEKEVEAKEEAKPEAEAKEEPAEEEKAEEPKAEEKPAEKEEAKTEDKAEAKEEPAKEEKAEEPKKEEAKAEEKPAEKEEAKAEKKSAAPEKVSTDMNATEAIDLIKDTPLEELEGFVPEDEDRVTVQRAWESKQSE